jgi:HTH-type transcriptional regulator/antitoxin HigA
MQNITRLWIVQPFRNSNMKSISNETEYNAVVNRINELLEIVTDENYNTVPEAIELDFLSDLVEEYESKYYPVTTPSIIDATQPVIQSM